MPEDRLTFGDFMKNLRVEAGLSYENAARRIGVGVETLKGWEADAALPSELSSERISRVYGIPEQEWLKALTKANNAKKNDSS